MSSAAAHKASFLTSQADIVETEVGQGKARPAQVAWLRAKPCGAAKATGSRVGKAAAGPIGTQKHTKTVFRGWPSSTQR